MTLTLVDSPVSGTEVHTNGLIVVRLADYPGGARGTLAVVTDGNSPAGDALKDTQNLSAATTFTDRYSSVANTAEVTIADFGLTGTDYLYEAYLSLRVVGRAPTNARHAEAWNSQDTSLGPSVATLLDGSVQSTHCRIPRETYAHYTMVSLGTFVDADMGGATEFQLRAWGVGTMELYLDLLYFVPWLINDDDTFTRYFPGDYPSMGLFSGSVDPDEDHSANLTVGGVHSVMPATAQDAIWDAGGSGWDYQVDDDEPIQVNMASGDFFEQETTNSYLICVGFGTRQVNYHTIETEDFAGAPSIASFAIQFKTSQSYMFDTYGGNFPGVYPPTTSPQIYIETNYMRAYGPGAAALPLTQRAFQPWRFGRLPSDGTDPTDPRTFCPTVNSIESFVELVAITPEVTPGGADVQFLTGACAPSTPTDVTDQGFCGAVLTHDDGDSMTLGLMKAWVNVDDGNGGWNLQGFGDSPVSAPGGTGSTTWVRVEKRWIHWRARAWADGDDEPETWDVEGFEPVSIINSISGGQFVQYPYDDNWITTGTNQMYHDPRDGHGFGAGIGYTPAGFVQLGDGFSVANFNCKFDNVEIFYDPDYPDGDGAYVDSTYRLEKYDGLEVWGTETTPTGALRVLETDYADHHFNFDEDGGTLFAWLDSGGHPLEAAMIGTIYARHYVRRFKPQIYRRPYG